MCAARVKCIAKFYVLANILQKIILWPDFMAFKTWQNCQKFFFVDSNTSESSVQKYKDHITSPESKCSEVQRSCRIPEQYFKNTKVMNI